ncbi:hypothetical protein DT594_01755 [Halopseudomonas laoshanensis]|uniref:Uncharacterized protein n=1 Tax=Halopseudomonas laoshanensis TaxID=2268758 RepID=A0A7V7GVF2_9GAMM|nr:hypothetical protein [Halopseudomonas laoshanensis]KAA0696110.1 hypothetical protein DT594_01755 [Halopseudomonas laoshanensis]
MAVRLEFLTQDTAEVELARRYWAMDAEGLFLEKVKDLVPFRDLTQSSFLSMRVRKYCIAYDENQFCRQCGGMVLVTKRTEPKKVLQMSDRPCSECEKRTNERELQERQTVREKLQRRVDTYSYQVRFETISYERLSDDVCLLLLAIDALITPKLANGTFKERECEALSPIGCETYLRSLYEQKIIRDDPAAACKEAYFFEDGQLRMRWDKADFFLLPDEMSGRGPVALEKVTERIFTDSEALSNLWLDFAVSDVIRYLVDQCQTYNLPLQSDSIVKIKGIVRQGLRIYSVSQLWSVVWKIVKDAASLASREYYNRTKAAATIPNKIIRQLEKAEQNGGINYSWHRPEKHIAGSLGMMFFKHFELNEYTPGSEALNRLSSLGHQSTKHG